MTKGVSPTGRNYFPVFPYTSFQLMEKNDLLALKAYIFSIPPVNKKNIDHDLIFPVGKDITMYFWKKFVWKARNFSKNPDKDKTWNRGAYLVEAVAHCGECHTPRNLLGGLNFRLNLAGTIEGPEGEVAPNITPDIKTGIGSWSKIDVSFFLSSGIKPDGDNSQGLMGELIELGYQFLNNEDLNSISEYLSTLLPIDNNLRKN